MKIIRQAYDNYARYKVDYSDEYEECNAYDELENNFIIFDSEDADEGFEDFDDFSEK